MGITVEFFSASPQEIVDVFTLSLEDIDRFVGLLELYPVADFSLHLQIPEDMDRLCRAMRRNNLSAPLIFRELLVEQLWYDGSSESLASIDKNFALVWSEIDDSSLENITIDWSMEFHYQEPLHQTPAYKALLELRKVAQDVITQNTSLILHLLGSPLF